LVKAINEAVAPIINNTSNEIRIKAEYRVILILHTSSKVASFMTENLYLSRQVRFLISLFAILYNLDELILALPEAMFCTDSHS
jgi:hypothetical protein